MVEHLGRNRLPSRVRAGPLDGRCRRADRRHATPHEILDAALASCTTLSLQLYVKHKGWQVGRIGVAVAHKHVQGVYRLERQISVEGDLTDEQRDALLRVAQACPVYQTLTGDIAVNTSLP